MTRPTRQPVALPVALVAFLACHRPPVPAPEKIFLLAGDAARVGELEIPVSLVAAVARSRGIAPRPALDRLVEDALLAQGARRAALERARDVAWPCNVVLARLVPRRLQEQARARGGPSDEELAQVRVIHAVVLRSATLPQARAVALAGTIAGAVSRARDDHDFEARVADVSHPGVNVRVERLPPFDASGRTEDGDAFDPKFVAAAVALDSPGETSGIVETPFGWHVLRLIERRKPDAASLERRRDEVGGAVVAMRARLELERTITASRKRVAVEVSVAADRLMAQAVHAFAPPPSAQ